MTSAMSDGVKPCPICGAERSRHERTINMFGLVRCESCGFVFANLSDERILAENNVFDDVETANYERIQTQLDRLWFALVADRLERHVRTAAPRCLDVGCGNGWLIAELRARGWDAAGLDPSPWARSAADQDGFELHCGYVEDGTMPPASYDVVTSTSALEHIPDPVHHIRAMLRLLKPGGIAYLAGMPNYGSATVRLGISVFHHNEPPWHANFFTPVTIRRMFGRPELGPLAEAVTIRTYGIPDLHWAYNRFNGLVRGARKGGSGAPSRSAPSRSKRLFLKANYLMGRAGGLGDKLEVTAVRSAAA